MRSSKQVTPLAKFNGEKASMDKAVLRILDILVGFRIPGPRIYASN